MTTATIEQQLITEQAVEISMNLADQLSGLDFDDIYGTWCMSTKTPMETHWQCNVRDDSYSMSATCYRYIGAVSVSAHFPLHVPAAAAMSYLTKQLNMSKVAHVLMCAER
jgi:hypothetical protein